MKYRNVYLWLALLAFCITTPFLGYSEGSRFLDREVQLTSDSTGVESFPMLVNLTVKFKGTRGFGSVRRLDLATGYSGGMGIYFDCVNEKGDKRLIGYDDTGNPDGRREGLPSSYLLKPGESISITFDLNQLLLRDVRAYRKWSRPLPPGQWTIRANVYPEAVSNAKTVTVREPNDAEEALLRDMKDQGVARRWFPSVMLKDFVMPSPDRLPAETRKICELIALLRTALSSPSQGLKALDTSLTEWGELEMLVNELNYECLRESKGAAAPEVATALDSLRVQQDMAGVANRIQKRGGILARLREEESER